MRALGVASVQILSLEKTDVGYRQSCARPLLSPRRTMASFTAASSRMTARPASSRRVALPRRARTTACSAAAAPGGGQTPYEALGLSNDADFDTVKVPQLRGGTVFIG